MISVSQSKTPSSVFRSDFDFHQHYISDRIGNKAIKCVITFLHSTVSTSRWVPNM